MERESQGDTKGEPMIVAVSLVPWKEVGKHQTNLLPEGLVEFLICLCVLREESHEYRRV